MAEAEKDAAADLPRLVLHVDINKTLIICDPVRCFSASLLLNI